MTENAAGSEPAKQADRPPVSTASDEQLMAMLIDRARSEGLQLSEEGGLLQQLTKRVLESALDGEITEHVGYDKHDPAGKNSGNSRNGTRAKTVLTGRRPGRGEGARRWARHLRAADRPQAAAPFDRGG